MVVVVLPSKGCEPRLLRDEKDQSSSLVAHALRDLTFIVENSGLDLETRTA